MANQKISINPQDLIPECCHGIYAPTEEDLIFIGSKNIKQLRNDWRGEKRSIYQELRYIQSRIDLLAGKAPDDIKKMAAEYENPEFPNIGVPDNPRARDPEPLDEDSINRKFGATTFNVCGWCKYCGGGLQHHGCIITVFNCPLIPKEVQGENKFRFDTPCVLTNATQEVLDICVAHKRERKAEMLLRRQQIAACICHLTEAMKKAEEKPYFTSLRPYKHFSVGDPVMFYTSNFDCITPSKTYTFISGRVVGTEWQDNIIEVCADEPVHDGEWYDGCSITFGRTSHAILHTWEYDYLKSHPDYLKVWLRVTKTDFDSERFSDALLNG